MTEAGWSQIHNRSNCLAPVGASTAPGMGPGPGAGSGTGWELGFATGRNRTKEQWGIREGEKHSVIHLSAQSGLF